jgi:hypothetical protein
MIPFTQGRLGNISLLSPEAWDFVNTLECVWRNGILVWMVVDVDSSR